ncbi:MAG TPA: MarP family serine protease [Acidimicrobiales bacterium]
MNLLDVLILLLVLAAVIRGFYAGFVLQLGLFVGAGVGILLGALLAPSVSQMADSPQGEAWLAIGTVLLGVALFGAAGQLAGERLSYRLQRGHLATADSALGGVFSAVATLVAVWLVAASIASAEVGNLGPLVQESVVLRTLDRNLPPVPSVLARIGRFTDTLGFPPVFEGFEPTPAAPVTPPSDADVLAAVAAAQASTVKIEGEGCGGIVEGSGWVVAPGYVLTNAHVVAGVRAPEVVVPEPSRPAVPVLFDHDLDIAILRVDGLTAPPLTLVAEAPLRGATGAALGFPRGGPFSAQPAAVRTVYVARGRDIYGETLVSREVEELQVLVQPGNSGGPFVLADGTVGGVIFARSLTNSAIGYALGPQEVHRRIDAAVGATSPVPTGRCPAG